MSDPALKLKTMALFSSKTILEKSLLLLKWPILPVLTEGEI